MFGFLKKLFAGAPAAARVAKAGTLGVDELSRRLGMSQAQLRATPIAYHRFERAKRTGGTRTILAPEPQLKALQRRILHRLLRRLRAHPAATGFERGHSIVTNALVHVGQEVVIKLDLQDFFGSIRSQRIDNYFRTIGWNEQASALLTSLCTHDGALPQGAPTSPRLSNLVNHRLDARIAALAEARGVSYSRYADDITLSSRHISGRAKRVNPKAVESLHTGADRINDLIHIIKQIAREEGYTLHTQKKLRIARRHDRQVVTGLVVNKKVQLPRKTRRRLRAIEHRLRTGETATMTEQQLAGWRALQHMIATQATNK